MLTTAARLALPLLLFGLAEATQFSPLLFPPSGGTVLGFHVGPQTGMLQYGPKGISVRGSANDTLPDSDVTSIQPWMGTEGAFLAVHADGRLDKLTVKSSTGNAFSLQLTPLGRLPYAGLKVVAGPWLIAWSSYEGLPYASADGKTWSQLSAGTGSNLADVTFDAQGHAIAIERSGRVWRQGSLLAGWELRSNQTQFLGQAVYGGGAQLHASFLIPLVTFVGGGGYQGLSMRSTDEGATWEADTARLGLEAVARYFDDGNKQVTLINMDGSKVFRQAALSKAWIRQDADLPGFLKLFPGASPGYTGFSESAGLAFVSSRLGIFRHMGGAWNEESADGFGKEPIRDLAFEADGTMWAGTARGLYRFSVPSADEPAFAWKRASYTVNAVTIDKQGVFHSGFSRSEDRGATWIRDPESDARFPSGYSSAPFVQEAATSFVDEDGNSYAAPRQQDSIHLYTRVGGGEWRPTGLSIAKRGVPVMSEDFFASDGRGGMYYGLFNIDLKGMLWKGGATGTWTPDTAGIGGRRIDAMVADRQGRMLAATADGVFRREAAGWKPLTPAHPLVALSLSVDEAGNVGAVGESGMFYLWLEGSDNWADVDTYGETISKVIAHGNSTYALGPTAAFVLDGPSAVRSQAHARSGAPLRFSAGKIFLTGTRVLDLRGRTLPEPRILR
jgi:hypothetical protein